MDVLVTPDVLSFLEIKSTTLKVESRFQICSLFAFSNDYIAVIHSEEIVEPDKFQLIYLDTTNGSLQAEIKLDTIVRTESKHCIIKYAYENLSYHGNVCKKWNSLLAFNHYHQMRKEERLPINTTTINILKMRSAEARVWTHNEQHDCVLHDLSYSGARLFCIDDFVINGDQKMILQLSFLEPCEIATLRSVVIRHRRIELGGINCNEMAVRFLEPVDLVYLERMASYHKNMTRQYSFT